MRNFINNGFIPSKTAQNSLNFITREDENNLSKYSNIEQVQSIIKLIYVLLNESYKDIPIENLIPHLLINLFQKYKVENLSNIFFSD